LQLDNRYITTNSSNLAHNLATLKINNNHKIITYDNKDLYVNIPIDETIRIPKHQLLKNDIHITKQIIAVLKIILEQNCFAFQKIIYHPNKGTAMGSPISGTMAQLFLHYIKVNT
jgi:hypothetical protein